MYPPYPPTKRFPLISIVDGVLLKIWMVFGYARIEFLRCCSEIHLPICGKFPVCLQLDSKEKWNFSLNGPVVWRMRCNYTEFVRQLSHECSTYKIVSIEINHYVHRAHNPFFVSTHQHSHPNGNFVVYCEIYKMPNWMRFSSISPSSWYLPAQIDNV